LEFLRNQKGATIEIQYCADIRTRQRVSSPSIAPSLVSKHNKEEYNTNYAKKMENA